MELAKSNAEEFQLRNGGVNAGFDQLSFLAEGLAPQFDKLNAIANRTYRAGQIMAYAGCDKGCYIGFSVIWWLRKRGSMENLNSFLEPGQRVQHPNQPDWGIGQVQSNVNNHITGNFPEAGKVVIDGSRIVLILVN